MENWLLEGQRDPWNAVGMVKENGGHIRSGASHGRPVENDKWSTCVAPDPSTAGSGGCKESSDVK